MTAIVVVDVDAGIDDVYALTLLIYAQRMGLVTIAAIICSAGNSVIFHTCRNVMRTLEIHERTDIPVYQGINKPLVAGKYFDYYFGYDAFGDVKGLWEPNMHRLRRKHNAVQMLYDLANQFPGQVSLLCLCPLSFAAVALIQYDKIPLKDVWMMAGNSTESEMPEFNMKNDPEAAHGVLKRMGVPIYMLTFENSEDPLLTVYWRKNILGSIPNNIMALLNAAERRMLQNLDPYEKWVICDPIVVAVMFFPEIHWTKSAHCATVSLNSSNTYNAGGYLLLKSQCSYNNIIFIENVDMRAYGNVLYKVFSSF